ncbi:peroxisomal membrane protein pex14 [Tulasnella sp. 403]|nr:peroxisomal membrane protein pex14 [Tulasnella sp. 403]
MSGDSTLRTSLVANAVNFLRDPKTQEATIDKRVEFLRLKGLTGAEIEEALRQVGITMSIPSEKATTGASSEEELFSVPTSAVPKTPTAYPYQPPPTYSYATNPPPAPVERDWKDWFVITVISGGAMMGAYALARKYLFPHLAPPPLTAFQESQTSLEAQFERVAQQISELSEQTQTQFKLVEEQKEHVERATTEVERALEDMKAEEKRSKAELQEIKDEIANIRDMVPKLIQSSQANATSTLADVQQELKSLKALLLSRPQSLPFSAGTPGSASPTPTRGSPGALPYGVGASPQQTPGSAEGASAATNLLSGRPLIPAWQLASKSSSASAKPADENRSTTDSGEAAKEKGKDKDIEFPTVPVRQT